MPISNDRFSLSRFLVSAGALVVIVAGLRAAKPLIVPFLTAAFIAVICFPVLAWLQSKRVAKGIALLAILAGLVLIGGLLVMIIGNSLTGFNENLPTYQARFEQQIQHATAWLAEHKIDVSGILTGLDFKSQRATGLIAGLVGGVSSLLSDGLVILLTVVLLLLEMATIPEKLAVAFGTSHSSVAIVRRIAHETRRYMALKTMVSLMTGVVATLMLMCFGVDYPVLWGLLAFLLNFVPTIGSLIAAAPPVVLAWLQFDLAIAIYVAIGYAILNMVIGNLIEPRLMGRSLGLSTLVVFVSLVFWGWVLGPIGMILSVPLTMTIKIALENIDEARPIAVLLDSEATSYAVSKVATTNEGEAREASGDTHAPAQEPTSDAHESVREATGDMHGSGAE